jgi:hypothetical protein
MTQLTISVANEAKYKALLAFIAQEGDIIITPKIKKTPKINLNDFWGAAVQPQSMADIDNQLKEIRQFSTHQKIEIYEPV